MIGEGSGRTPPPREIVAFHDHGSPMSDLARVVLDALGQEPKSLAGLALIDRRSAALRQLCGLPEYYLQRCEVEILRTHGEAIAAVIGAHAQLIGIGGGCLDQIRHLISALTDPWAFVTVDDEREGLLADARLVQQLWPRLWVEAVRADLQASMTLPPNAGGGRRIAYMPGNIIGNFDPASAIGLLAQLGAAVGAGGLILVTVDLRKSPLIVSSAYDDPHGCNQALILGVLDRLNRQLDATFDPRLFEHHVRYEPERGCVSANLVSLGPQDVRIAGTVFRFAQGEALLVERSWKYEVDDFRALARGAGLRPIGLWQDARAYVGSFLLEVMPTD
ncbi:L-histidine N(alpha)-methyltransferase [Rhizorhabdus sp.]|uniref:L-histidine N(alpha)-methyltransferase n=1 Tax=Rhizorhabdus sp. TaxID=1968843 RepID=UPI0025FFD183|nr:L-histidine N(alpha)-methyltransferase [Rhizorhabdus sp.]